MRPRVKPLLLAAFASLVLVGLLAPAADGANVYEADRPGFHFTIQTAGERVTSASVGFRARCRGGPTTSKRAGFALGGPIDARTGQFSLQRSERRDPEILVEWRLGGWVDAGVVHGRFSFRRIVPPGRPHPCWSGRSLSDPWVRFVASPRPEPPPSAHYKTSQPPGFSAAFRVRGHRVVAVELTYRYRCDRRWRGEGSSRRSDLPINPHSGRFGFRSRQLSDFANGFMALRARLRGREIRGRFAYAEFYVPGGGSKSCHIFTGRSYSDPWIHFVARRVHALRRGLG